MRRTLVSIAWVAVLPFFVAAQDPPKPTRAERLREAERLHTDGIKLLQAGRTKEGTSGVEAGLKIWRELAVKDSSVEVASGHAASATDLAIAYARGNDLGRGIPVALEAVTVCRRLYPDDRFTPDHARRATAENTLASMLLRAGRAKEAIPYYESSLNLRRKVYSADRHPKGHSVLLMTVTNLGLAWDTVGRVDVGVKLVREALEMARKLYPAAEHPQGHSTIADVLNLLASMELTAGQANSSLEHHREALAMLEKVLPPEQLARGHPHVFRSLLNQAVVLNAIGHQAESAAMANRALDAGHRLEKVDPSVRSMLADTYSLLAHIHTESGNHGDALVAVDRCLTIRQALYPPEQFPQGHRAIAQAYQRRASIHLGRGDSAPARRDAESALAIYRKVFPPTTHPDGHLDLAFGLATVGTTIISSGDPVQAIRYMEDALAMVRRVLPESSYPRGHPDHATILSNIGGLLTGAGEYARAVEYARLALEMQRKLYPPSEYPQGHVQVATSLDNLANIERFLGHRDRAAELYREALAMMEKLFPTNRNPNGHPETARIALNAGSLACDARDPRSARTLLRRAEENFDRIYPASAFPQGHPHLAGLHSLMGRLHWLESKPKESIESYARALRIHGHFLERFAASASEMEALKALADAPTARHALLFSSREQPDFDALVYEDVRRSKAALTRIYEQRHSAARLRLNADAQSQAWWNELLSVRRQSAHLVLTPGPDAAYRERTLAELGVRQGALERRLAALMPELSAVPDASVADWQSALPGDAAFVDIIAYSSSDYATGKRVPAYALFVLVPGQPVQRIEIAQAQDLNAAILRWRTAIEERRDEPVPAILSDRLWTPLRKRIPLTTRTLYVSPDGALARIPWAALPGSSRGSILLEEFTGGIALEPHGDFLYKRLKLLPAARPIRAVLNLGNVDYDGPEAIGAPYMALPGTQIEQRQITAIVGSEAIVLSGSAASVEAVHERLAKVGIAHLATHGFFDADRLTADRRRRRDLVQRDSFTQRTSAFEIAPTSPLSYTGLVLAGANQQRGGILTAEEIVLLPLEQLRLCILSACETGLGDLTEGEGVQGLQRAFHLAGCPNVIASLWNVNDAATAALMAKFYHELWINKKPPIEALREAQLTIYWRPDLIPDLAGERGAPKLKDAFAVKISEAGASATGDRKRADTKLWAAFVLSGVGK